MWDSRENTYVIGWESSCSLLATLVCHYGACINMYADAKRMLWQMRQNNDDVCVFFADVAVWLVALVFWAASIRSRGGEVKQPRSNRCLCSNQRERRIERSESEKSCTEVAKQTLEKKLTVSYIWNHFCILSCFIIPWGACNLLAARLIISFHSFLRQIQRWGLDISSTSIPRREQTKPL